MRRPSAYTLGLHFGQLLIPMAVIGGVVLLLNTACPSLAVGAQARDEGCVELATRFYEMAEDGEERTWTRSLFVIGRVLIDGDRVPKNPIKGAECIQMAAQLGHPPAQALLAGLYTIGLGVLQDDATAHTWATIATLQGADSALELRDYLATELSPNELAASQQRVRAWLEAQR